MPEIGDRVEVQSKAGTRQGKVARVSGAMVTVEWDTGGQTTVIPAPGVMSVIGGGRRAPAAGTRKMPATKTPAKKTPATGKKAPATGKKAPAKAKKAPASAVATKKGATAKKAGPAGRKKTATKKAAAKKKRR